jgi:hypothetical protein
MVGQFLFLICLMMISVLSEQAWALLNQTQADLNIFEDQLRFEVEKNPTILQDWAPFLVATPQYYWKESKTDFSTASLETVKRVFPQGVLIPCSECAQQRTFVANDGRLVVSNGELSLVDLANLKTQAVYREAKSILIIKETPAGIDARVMSLSDGRILFLKLADSTKTLDTAVAPLNLARELERREKGESLNYVFMDLGLYPKSTFQFEFLEQWGNRNQHLFGFDLSLWGPAGGLGVTYHYLLPTNRRFNFAGTFFVTLDTLAMSKDTSGNPSRIVSQGMVQYALSGNYAVFGMINSQEIVSFGITFLNPVLFPFLL